MPIPKRDDGQSVNDFMTSCMSNSKMQEEYPDTKQRAAVCSSNAGYISDQVNANLLTMSQEWDDEWEEWVEEVHLPEEAQSAMLQNEEYEYEAMAADSKKKKNVKLNKPFRTPSGPKKFSVYVKNEKGNIIKVNFGSREMEIKRDDPIRRKSFRARHKCDEAKDKTTPRYWSCKQWRANVKVQD